MEEKNLGDYKILKQIGQGALGTVLLAEHRFIKKPYVLKVLPPEFSQDKGFIQRFEEEVSKLAALEHPHIVKIHNISFADGVYFLVNDCIVDSIGETTNLAQYMSGRKERLREDELFALLQQIASALDFAHFGTHRVAHLSLKLSNILVGKANPGISISISGFGLAKIVGVGPLLFRSFKAVAESLSLLNEEESRGNEKYIPLPVDVHKISKLSQSFMQSYAFLAPEQKKPSELVNETACDVYAFGVLAYYLISGHFPEGVFPPVKEIAPEYKKDWDKLIQACLQTTYQSRPDKLVPYLETLFSKETEIVESFTPPSPRVVEEEEKAFVVQTLTAEKLREKLAKKIEAPKEQEAKVAVSAAAPVPVEKADALASIPPAITPPKDEEYSQKLSQMLNREPIVTEYHPETKVKKQIEPILTEMSVIPEGQYMRGSNAGARDEMPKHPIELPPFAIDVHPVTNEQFVRFLEYTGGEKDANYNDLIRLKDSRITRSAGRLLIESGYSKHPVVGVTWYGAQAYAKWVGKRLPYEAEWEVAALGGTDYPYPSGETIEKSQANFFSSDTTAVKSYAPNNYGLYDMAGNVYEWCQDWYGYNYYETSSQEPHYPKGPLQGVYRVLRGGCWKSLVEDLRCSHRHRNNPGTFLGTYGFRCASDV